MSHNDKKAPPCQILKPAPWQEKHDLEESSGWERDEHTTDELTTEELVALVYKAEATREGPTSDVTTDNSSKDT